MMMLKAEMIKAVETRGQRRGAVNSLKAMSTNHIRPRLMINVKSPKVMICRGRVRTASKGFMNLFKSPMTIPRTRKICQSWVRETPKTFESGRIVTFTPEMNIDETHNPAVAAIIWESIFLMLGVSITGFLQKARLHT